MVNSDPTVSWLLGIFNEMYKKKLYGKVIFEFKEGEIVLVRTEEVQKPPTRTAT
jgi:hypothetical protein